MARFLALDWDHDRIHLVAVTTSRGAVRIEKALFWEEKGGPNPATAEAAGQRLREQLKSAGIAAAPVLACAGREQIILKEIRYPRTDPSQEASLVRFQATRELAAPPESVIIDYTPLEQQGTQGERRALLYIARRELVAAYKTLCKAAGLKLLTVTPRSFGIAGCPRPTAFAGTDVAVALLILSASWAEFCVVRGGSLLYARPLATGGNPLAEVRRNLSLYAGQPHITGTRDIVQTLYVAVEGDAPGLRERLAELLAIPVMPLEPFAGQDHLGQVSDGAGFTSVVGLARLWSERSAAPVNFLAPKEPKQAADPVRAKLVRVGGLAILGLILVAFLGSLVLGAQRDDIDDLTREKERLDSRLKLLQPEKGSLLALKDWQDTAVPVLDEIYDLTARFPWRVGCRVTNLSVSPVPRNNTNKTTAKDPYTMRLVLTGVVMQEDVPLINTLMDTINRDTHCRAVVESIRSAGAGDNSSGKGQGLHEFTLVIAVHRQPANGYVTHLDPPPAPRVERMNKGDDGGFEGFPGEGEP